MSVISRNEPIIVTTALVATVLARVLHFSQVGGDVLAFVVAGVGLALTLALVLLSFVVSDTHLQLVPPPLLVVALALSAILGTFVVYDGESIWLEGVALIACTA